jgi:hypothetical protein
MGKGGSARRHAQVDVVAGLSRPRHPSPLVNHAASLV